MAAFEAYGQQDTDLLLAYIVGIEVACKLGAAVNPTHFQMGWHATATLGVFGAAAAAAKCHAASAYEMANVFGLAAIHAGGLRANNGTLAKPYQVGNAAYAGVVASQLAKDGVSASTAIFEDRDGFNDLYNRGVLAGDVELGAPFEIESPGIMIKRYPACSGVAAAVDAVIAIAEQNALGPGDIESVSCVATPMACRSLPYQMPAMPLEGQFSMPYCLAVAIVRRAISPDDFTAETLQDERIRQLIPRIELRTDVDSEWAPADGPEGATVTVVTRNGQTHTEKRKEALGGPGSPMSIDELTLKVHSCIDPICGVDKAEAVVDLTLALEAPGVAAQLVRLLETLASAE